MRIKQDIITSEFVQELEGALCDDSCTSLTTIKREMISQIDSTMNT